MNLARPKLKATLGYVAFGVFAFVLGLYLTFPYATLKRFLIAQADAQGLQLRIGGLGPGLLGVTAYAVRVAPQPKADETPEALQLDSVSLRPSLFPLGVAARGKAMGGTLHATVGGLGDLSVHADFSDLDPSKGNFKGFTGIAAKGLASGSLSLDVPRTAPGLDGKPHDPNFAEATGGLTLDFDHFSIEGGQVTVPIYGTPTPVDLPRIAFGNLVATLDFTKGAGKLQTLHAKSDDLELDGSGTLRLAKRLPYSELDLSVKLKAEPEFVKRLGLLGSGISMLPVAPGSSGYRMAHLTGFLGSPRLAR
jgi:type II secretion system protein N